VSHATKTVGHLKYQMPMNKGFEEGSGSP